MPVVKEMALTPEEFFRGLGPAMQGLAYRVEGQVVEAGTSAQGISISIRPLPPRVLGGLLSVPRARVTISFRGYDAQAEAEFLNRFDRAFHRGGG